MLNPHTTECPDAEFWELSKGQISNETEEGRCQSRDAIWAKRAQAVVARRRKEERQLQSEVSWVVRCIHAWNAFWTIRCEADIPGTEAEELRSEKQTLVQRSFEVLLQFEYEGNETDLYEFNEMLREDYVAECSKIRRVYATQDIGSEH